MYKLRTSRSHKLKAAAFWCLDAGVFLAAALLINLHPIDEVGWVTLSGQADDAASDFIQLDLEPAPPLIPERHLRLRVNRASEVDGAGGVRYRSFTGAVRVNCHERHAHYVSGTYYKAPNFAGKPVAQKTFDDPEHYPLRLAGFGDNYAEQVIRAACTAEPAG